MYSNTVFWCNCVDLNSRNNLRVMNEFEGFLERKICRGATNNYNVEKGCNEGMSQIVHWLDHRLVLKHKAENLWPNQIFRFVVEFVTFLIFFLKLSSLSLGSQSSCRREEGRREGDNWCLLPKSGCLSSLVNIFWPMYFSINHAVSAVVYFSINLTYIFHF